MSSRLIAAGGTLPQPPKWSQGADSRLSPDCMQSCRSINSPVHLLSLGCTCPYSVFSCFAYNVFCGPFVGAPMSGLSSSWRKGTDKPSEQLRLFEVLQGSLRNSARRAGAVFGAADGEFSSSTTGRISYIESLDSDESVVNGLCSYDRQELASTSNSCGHCNNSSSWAFCNCWSINSREHRHLRISTVLHPADKAIAEASSIEFLHCAQLSSPWDHPIGSLYRARHNLQTTNGWLLLRGGVSSVIQLCHINSIPRRPR